MGLLLSCLHLWEVDFVNLVGGACVPVFAFHTRRSWAADTVGGA